MSDSAQLGGGPAVTAAYLPGVRGHAVLAYGPDAEGRAALAAWQLNAAGDAVGSWEIPIEADPERVGGILSGLRGCALVDWDRSGPEATLGHVARLLPGGLADRLVSTSLALPSLLAEIRDRRRRCEEIVQVAVDVPASAPPPGRVVPVEFGGGGLGAALLATEHLASEQWAEPAAAPATSGLAWPSAVPDDAAAPGRLTRRRAVNSPVAAHALGLASAVRNAIALWTDTERVRCAYPELRVLGGPQSLPPHWLDGLRAAAGPL